MKPFPLPPGWFRHYCPGPRWYAFYDARGDIQGVSVRDDRAWRLDLWAAYVWDGAGGTR